RVPAYPSFSGSLLGQPSPLIALVAALLAVVIGVVAGSAICGSVRHDAGLFCAAVGLAALSFRAGPMRATLLSATGPAVYLWLAVELLILFGILMLARLLQRNMIRTGVLRAEEEYDPVAVS